MIKATREIVHSGISAEEAFAIYENEKNGK
jgi:hypothetical protein